jgi:hypothetical protein
MPTAIRSVANRQTLEVAVTGPGTARRLFIVTGTADIPLAAPSRFDGSGSVRDTFTLLVGPTLVPSQFVKAVATASPSDIQLILSDTPEANVTFSIDFVDADFDEDSGQTELRIEATTATTAGTQTGLTKVAFQASILATA